MHKILKDRCFGEGHSRQKRKITLKKAWPQKFMVYIQRK